MPQNPTNNAGCSARAGEAIDENYFHTRGYQVLTDAASIVYDCDLGVNARVVLGASRTIPVPQNAQPGDTGVFTIVQDGTGSRLATWASGWKWVGGTDLVLSTGASAIDLLHWYTPDGTNFYVLSTGKAYAT